MTAGAGETTYQLLGLLAAVAALCLPASLILMALQFLANRKRKSLDDALSQHTDAERARLIAKSRISNPGTSQADRGGGFEAHPPAQGQSRLGAHNVRGHTAKDGNATPLSTPVVHAVEIDDVRQ